MSDLPYQKHSDTSKNAAESMKNSAQSCRARVFEFIKNRGPCSDEQIQQGLKMNPSTQRPRRIELVVMKLIEPYGFTKTKSNRDATLWRVKNDD